MALTPLHLWLLGLTLTTKLSAASALAFLPPSSQYRHLLAILILALYFVFYRDTQLLKVEALRITVNTFSVIQVGNIIDLLCITKLSFPTTSSAAADESENEASKSKQHRAAAKAKRAGFVEKLSWGLAMIWNFRGIGTPQEVRGIPQFQRGDVPSRAAFLFQRCTKIAVYVAILKAWGGGWPLLSPSVDMAFPKQYLFSRMRHVSSNELFVRVWATILFWTKGYLNHTVAYDVLSAILVASGLSSPRSWPPMYGSLKDCYSVRAWWGKTWHQLLRKQLTSFSNAVVFDMCRLQRQTLLARYSNTFLTFFISGAYHILSDGVEVESGVMSFFLMQAAAIVVEDAFQAMCRRSGRPLGARWERFLGYAWVCVFLVWTSPGWRYPVLVYRFRHEAL